MHKYLICLAGTAAALAFSGPVHAQLLGGNVGGGVTGGLTGQTGVAGVGAETRAGLDANIGSAARVGSESVGAVARTPAGVDATVRGGSFQRQPQAAANAAARANLGVNADASAPAEVRAQAAIRSQGEAYAPQHFDHGSYVWVESRGWVWVPRGARLNADGTVSASAGAALDAVSGVAADTAASLNAGARVSGGLGR